jgi:AcrR family transcriptional regulator
MWAILSCVKKLNLEQFLGKVLGLLSKHAPSDLSYSQLSRLTGVPRPTLYYYFGKDQAKLFEEAVKFGMKAFMQLYRFDEDLGRFTDWRSFQQARIHEAILLVGRHPWAPGLYFRYRNHPGKWGKMIRDAEDLYCRQLGKVWEGFHGKTPDPKSIRLSGYLKLGVLWGVAAERESWFEGQSEKSLLELSTQITDLITPCFEGRFGN